MLTNADDVTVHNVNVAASADDNGSAWNSGTLCDTEDVTV